MLVIMEYWIHWKALDIEYTTNKISIAHRRLYTLYPPGGIPPEAFGTVSPSNGSSGKQKKIKLID